MKKLFLFLLALPALMLATSCSDDNELPEVTLGFNYSNATEADDILYVVQGDTLRIDDVTITPKEGTKQAQILSVLYRFDGYIVNGSAVAPFTANLPTATLTPGRYLLGIECQVVQVDKTPATAYIRNIVQVVADASEIPSPASSTPGVYVASRADIQQ